jgi:hypothetical protein
MRHLYPDHTPDDPRADDRPEPPTPERCATCGGLPDVKPAPFGRYYGVSCENCADYDVRVNIGPTRDAAIRSWNEEQAEHARGGK